MRTVFYFGGCFLLGCLLAGCGRQSRTIGYKAEAAASETDNVFASDQDATAPSKSADEFPFPTDRGGQLLANQLRPANQIPPLPNEKPAGSKRRSGSANVENPEISLPPVVVPAPPSIPLAKAKQVRPTLVEGEPPLSRQRFDLRDPAPVKLAAGPKVAGRRPGPGRSRSHRARSISEIVDPRPVRASKCGPAANPAAGNQSAGCHSAPTGT
jgi:hypothetical protein